jgi:hypothetical protein
MMHRSGAQVGAPTTIEFYRGFISLLPGSLVSSALPEYPFPASARSTLFKFNFQSLDRFSTHRYRTINHFAAAAFTRELRHFSLWLIVIILLAVVSEPTVEDLDLCIPYLGNLVRLHNVVDAGNPTITGLTRVLFK